MKPHFTSKPALISLYVLGIAAISFSAILIKWSQAEASVMGMYRLLLTNLLLLPFIGVYRREIVRLTLRQWGLLLLAGLALGLHFLLWMLSLRYTTVASSTIILAFQPIAVLVGSFYFFRLRANRAMLAGMAIAVAGSALIGFGDFRVAGTALTGDLLSFLSVLAISGHMLLGKFLRGGISAFVYNFFVFAFACLALALYNLARDIPFGGYSSREWGLFLLLAIIPTLFGHYLFNWLLKHMNASVVSMAILGEPVGASLLAWQLLGEQLTLMQGLAGLLILVGVWVFIRFGKEEKRSGELSRIEGTVSTHTKDLGRP